MSGGRPRVLPGLAATVGAGCLVVAIVLVRAGGTDDPAPAPTTEPTFRSGGRSFAYPAPEPGATTPLGEPPDAPAGGAHVFSRTQEGTDDPVTWDPCRPIRVVVDDRTAPEGALTLLAEALAEVERATGLRIDDEGPTDEPPTEDRAPVQPDRYGDRWAPVLVSWTDPATTPALAGDVGGLGGNVAVAPPDRPGTEVLVTGTLLLDGPQMGEALRVTGGRDQVRSVLLHELGHVVGLGHVDDPAELMHPEGQPGASGYGPGDRAGLARLGRGPCVPEL